MSKPCTIIPPPPPCWLITDSHRIPTPFHYLYIPLFLRIKLRHSQILIALYVTPKLVHGNLQSLDCYERTGIIDRYRLSNCLQHPCHWEMADCINGTKTAIIWTIIIYSATYVYMHSKDVPSCSTIWSYSQAINCPP